jgi:hypothetical protein
VADQRGLRNAAGVQGEGLNAPEPSAPGSARAGLRLFLSRLDEAAGADQLCVSPRYRPREDHLNTMAGPSAAVTETDDSAKMDDRRDACFSSFVRARGVTGGPPVHQETRRRLSKCAVGVATRPAGPADGLPSVLLAARKPCAYRGRLLDQDRLVTRRRLNAPDLCHVGVRPVRPNDLPARRSRRRLRAV